MRTKIGIDGMRISFECGKKMGVTQDRMQIFIIMGLTKKSYLIGLLISHFAFSLFFCRKN